MVSMALGQGAPDKREMNPRNMDAIRIWKLTEILELNEDQTLRFLPLVQIHERQIQQAHKEMEAMREKVDLALEKEKLSQKDADKLINLYIEKQNEVHKIKHDFIKSLPKYLSPEQQLLYVGFESRFRNELRDYMKDRRVGSDRRSNRRSKN